MYSDIFQIYFLCFAKCNKFEIIRMILALLRSVEGNGEIRLKTAPIDGVHVVGGAFVESSVHLCGRVNFDLRLDLVVADAPFVYVHIEVLIDLRSVLVPGDMGSGIALGHAQKGDLVAQNVLKIEVRGL